MLYVLHGNNTQKVREKLQALINQLHAKRPDAELFRIEGETFQREDVENLVGATGLFDEKHIVVLDCVCEENDITDLISHMETSDNMFLIVEESVDAKTLKLFEKHAKKVESFLNKESRNFNLFSLTDALGARNKKKVWLLYREALVTLKAEEVHGVCVWQIKSMILSLTSKSAKESGLKPFVYNKAKDFSKNYSLEELKTLSNTLIGMLYESRKGKDMETELERFLLKI